MWGIAEVEIIEPESRSQLIKLMIWIDVRSFADGVLLERVSEKRRFNPPNPLKKGE
jgi:hypothetical protein